MNNIKIPDIYEITDDSEKLLIKSTFTGRLYFILKLFIVIWYVAVIIIDIVDSLPYYEKYILPYFGAQMFQDYFFMGAVQLAVVCGLVHRKRFVFDKATGEVIIQRNYIWKKSTYVLVQSQIKGVHRVLNGKYPVNFPTVKNRYLKDNSLVISLKDGSSITLIRSYRERLIENTKVTIINFLKEKNYTVEAEYNDEISLGRSIMNLFRKK